MATTAKIAKEAKTPKFKIRLRNRCNRCGRPRAYMRKFALCRLCFRKLAHEGDIAGFQPVLEAAGAGERTTLRVIAES
jgi:small subunit ribosomal protein S14